MVPISSAFMSGASQKEAVSVITWSTTTTQSQLAIERRTLPELGELWQGFMPHA